MLKHDIDPATYSFSVSLREKGSKLRVWEGKARAAGRRMYQIFFRDILANVRISCDSSFFTALGRVFAQQRGAAIGNQISPVLASISVAFLEETWCNQYEHFLTSIQQISMLALCGQPDRPHRQAFDKSSSISARQIRDLSQQITEITEAITELVNHVRQVRGTLDSTVSDFNHHFDTVPSNTLPPAQLACCQGTLTIGLVFVSPKQTRSLETQRLLNGPSRLLELEIRYCWYLSSCSVDNRYNRGCVWVVILYLLDYK